MNLWDLKERDFWRSSQPLGLYVHIPFCARKCTYCDFNTYAGLQELIPATVNALCAEIRRWGIVTHHPPVDTVFWGGGTPTILAPGQMRQLMKALRNSFDILSESEITSEANPHSADQNRFAALAECGINRISLGAQSFQASELALLGRWHDAVAIGKAVNAARKAGFKNVNLDLIHGLPAQSLETWSANLGAALDLQVEHHSLYALTVEEGTPLARSVASGSVPQPDADLAACQYQYAQGRMAEAGYLHYEIANWSRESAGTAAFATTCLHNLRYWRNQNYLGFGPGAHSHWRGPSNSKAGFEVRWWNQDSVPGYNRALRQSASPVREVEEIGEDLGRAETMMLGLRLIKEGVNYGQFEERHGQDMRQVYASELQFLQERDLIKIEADRVRLSQTGIMFHNYVSQQFLPA